MTGGRVSAGGRWRSSVASTSFRHSSSFILKSDIAGFDVVFFRLEWLGDRLALRVGEDQLDLLLDLLELLMAEPGEVDALLEQLERLVERKLLALQSLDDFLELLEGFLEVVGAGLGHGHADSSGAAGSQPAGHRWFGGLRARRSTIVFGPHRFQSHRVAIDGALEAAFLE